MRYLSLAEVLDLHRRVIVQSGGASGLRDLGLLQSAMAQPRASFDGHDLHATLAEKAAALGYSLIGNHPFLDGNKRVGHAAMAVMLLLNGFDLEAAVDDSERLVLGVAEGSGSREELHAWVRAHIVQHPASM